MKKIYFTPGPSATYFTVEEHLRKAFKLQIPSISHRSTAFKILYAEVAENLTTLLNLPGDYQFGFTASATEVWDRQIENLVNQHTFHIVNGAFSSKSYAAAKAMKKTAVEHIAEHGQVADFSTLNIPEEAELICLAHNETSMGVATPLEDIYSLKQNYPDKLISLDVVSSLPVVDLDFNQVDSVYCSVQKAFGLPAGLGIWFFNEACLEKAAKVKEQGNHHSSYHAIQSLSKYHLNNQTPSTPNVLSIYLLGEVVKDMLTKGMDMIRRESKQKAALMYYMFDSNKIFTPFVKDTKVRSETVAVAEVDNPKELIDRLAAKGLVIGGGYGAYKTKHIRIANFPTHSKEQMELLVDSFFN